MHRILAGIARPAHLLVCLATLVLAATAPATASPGEAPPAAVGHAEGVAPHTGLDGVYEQFAAGYRELDPAAVATLYTEDARYLPPGQDVLRGREAVEGQFASFFSAVRRAGADLSIRFRILDRGVDEDLAYDVGIYTLTTLRDGEAVRTTRGKFVVVARKGPDGDWRFQVDGYSDLPEADKPGGEGS